MKQKLRGMKRRDKLYDYDLYRVRIPIAGQVGSSLSVLDLWPEKARDTIMFVHGYAGCLETWEFQINYFVRQNYRVIAPDLRGHGHSDAPDTYYTMPELVADLHGIVETLQLSDRFVLAGHSFGGSICVEYATAYPQTLSKMVLVATAGEYPLPRVANLIMRLPGAFFRPWWPYRPKWNAAYHVVQRMMMNNMRTWQGWPLMRKLDTPTLVITGERDFYFPRYVFDHVGEAIPGAEVVDVGSAKHKVQLERHQAVNRTIHRFVDASLQQASWRDQNAETEFALERIWQKDYAKGTPTTLPIPAHPAQRFLENAAEALPKRTATIFYGSRISYQDLDQQANQFANLLIQLGIEAGQRVLIVLPNMPQLIIAYYGVLKAGGVVVFPNPDAGAEEIVEQARQTGARLLVTLQGYSYMARLVKQMSDVEEVLWIQIRDAVTETVYQKLLDRWHVDEQAEYDAEEQDPFGLALHSVLNAQSSLPPNRSISSKDLAAIVFTSGTTQEPKGVCLTHHNIVANTLQIRHWTPQLEHGEEVCLSVIPMIHSYGMTSAMNVPIALAATIVMQSVFEVAQVLEQIKLHKPTIFPGVPSMYMAINQTPNVRDYGLSSIKACISGAAPLPVEVQEAFEKLTRGKLVEGYGLTEASPVTHANPLSEVRKAGSIGVPISNTEARIVDLITNKQTEIGQIGELQVRGPQVMQGYWKQNGAFDSSCITQDGWLCTGDVAVSDADGFFQIISRKRDTIMAGAYSVFPRDVEEVLYENNKVLEVAVVGLELDSSSPNGQLSGIRESNSDQNRQKIKAFVVPRPGSNLTAEELLDLCRKRLQEYAVPWEIEFREELPKSFVGKVLRRMLVQNDAMDR